MGFQCLIANEIIKTPWELPKMHQLWNVWFNRIGLNFELFTILVQLLWRQKLISVQRVYHMITIHHKDDSLFKQRVLVSLCVLISLCFFSFWHTILIPSMHFLSFFFFFFKYCRVSMWCQPEYKMCKLCISSSNCVYWVWLTVLKGAQIFPFSSRSHEMTFVCLILLPVCLVVCLSAEVTANTCSRFNSGLKKCSQSFGRDHCMSTQMFLHSL